MKRKLCFRTFSLVLALILCMSALISTLPVQAAAPTTDAEAIRQSYACKIVKADNSVVYYKYFSPMDQVGSTSAFATEGSSQSAIDALCATANVADGDTIYLLDDITLVKVSSGYGNRKNVQAGYCYIRTDSDASFTIDGNSHHYSAPAGFIAHKGSLTVKNLTYTLTGSEGIGHARNGHTLAFENCTLTIAGVRPADKKDGYFAFNTGVGTIDLRDTTITLAKGIVPELPLFHSNQTNSSLKLHNVVADYSKAYTGSEAEGWTEQATTVPLISATQSGMSVLMSGNTQLTSATKGIVLASGGSVVMNNNATLKIACASNGSYKSYQGIYAYGSGQSFSLTMNHSSKIVSGVVGVTLEQVDDSHPACASTTIVLNDYAEIDAHRSLRIGTAPATIYLNDSAKIYHTAEESFDGVATNNPLWVDGSNKECPIYVNADAIFAKKSTVTRVPYTYGSAISSLEGAEGLRFDSRIQADTEALEFGTLLIPTSALLNVNEFTHKDLADAKKKDASFKYLDVKSSEGHRLTYKLKENGSDFYLYSAIIGNVTDNHTQYSARAYAKYAKGSTDEDSISGIWVYSFYDKTSGGRSLAYTAYEAVNDTKLTAEEYSETVDSNGDGFYRFNVAEAGQTPAYSRYTKAQYDALKPLAEAYLIWCETAKSSENKAEFQNTAIQSGVNVHEVVIGDRNNSTQTTTILQVTDIHLNAHYDPDVDELKWPETTVANTNAQAALTYANGLNPDQIVITGDLFNAYSAENMALFETYVWSKTDASKTMVSLGNHDLIGTTDNAGKEVYAKNWAKDYESKVINGVLIIQLNNATSDKCAFSFEQAELLAKDLETARTNGYNVLLFYHIPLLTSNEADDKVNRLDNNGDENNASMNLYQSSIKDYKDWRTDYATQNVYDLIVRNADIIDAAFCGHKHVNLYSEIQGINGNIIPQYTLIGNAYGIGASVLKITVYN